ncbi:MAG: hypothetical protein JRJ87_10160 [Deltaproteobacteria bacterium]|nr:hypothetical protein [Deltaproteobacteria bacterium]
MKSRFIRYAIALTVSLAFASPGLAGEWKEAKSEKYGFSMSVPKGTILKAKEWKGGWGGLHANFLGVRLFGIAHLGKKHTAKEIETFGVLVTGIGPKHWKKIDEGRDKNGWEWFKTWKAVRGKLVVLGAYGVGPKGSYLLVLKTSLKSFNRDKAAYMKWYESLRVM